MIVKEEVKEIIEEILEGTPLFLVDLILQPGNRIQVFIDGDHDVTISDCRGLSSKIEKALDRDKEDFELTVSSSGIDRPLKFHRQFIKNVGRTLLIKTISEVELKGKLIAADDQGIEIEFAAPRSKKEKKQENAKLSYPDIKTARTEVSFGK
jgi:ribosome maturation factor RimP